jgi:hypothetical protein
MTTRLPASCQLSATCCIIAIALVVGLATSARAGTGAAVTFPQPGTKIKSGLLMTIDFRGVDANGYRPVRVEFKTITGAPLTADRQIRVVLTPNSYNAQSTTQVTQVIELPEGSTVTAATIAIPQSALWYSAKVDAFEDGEKLTDLSSPGIGWPGTNYWDWTEARPTVLVIDSNVPDRLTRDSLVMNVKSRGADPNPTYTLPEVRILNNLFPDPNRSNTYFADQKNSDATLLSQIADLPRLEMLPPTEMPERWIELSQYDLTIISLADLKTLATKESTKLEALADWAAGGPLLLITGVGNDFAGLAEIERVLKLPKLPVPQGAQEDFRGWTPADNEHHRPNLRSDFEDFQASMRPANTPNWQRQVYPQPRFNRPGVNPYATNDDQLAAPPQTPFVLRPNSLGVIVAIASDRPFPGKETDWIWVFNSVPRNHWMWYQRNGFSLHRTNDDYWTFLIPGVGEAPVVSFLLLVSLFAVLIGPVNYMLLGRSQRLYLLLITVPAGAVIVTGSLFTYALLTDGLGVRLRARSFTDLDQTTGRAVSWSRQSYYASIAPSRGLTFPDDATVFRILHMPSTSPRTGEPEQFVRWDEDQHLTDGYIASRTASQFMVLRATQSAAKLTVREGAAAADPPNATNDLNTDIRLLVICDSRGAWWTTENLAGESSAKLSPTTPVAAADMLKKLYGADPPGFPRGYDPNLHNNALSLFIPNYSWYNVDGGSSLPVMASSLLELNLANSTEPARALVPRTYLAVTKSSPVVPYGVPSVREESSLHIIRGRY